MKMKKDISNNYIVVQGFMVQDLELKGNELIAYSLIFGFSQDNETDFTGSVSYICTWLNCSKSTVLRTMDSLVKKGLIYKTSEVKNNVTFNRYKVNFSKINTNETSGVKMKPVVSKQSNKGCQNETKGGVKMKPNNIINNKDNNNIYSGYCFFSSTDFAECYKDFVNMRKKIKKPMTERAEKIILNKLTKMCGEDTKQAIEILERSILKNWQDVFELPKENLKPNNTVAKPNTPIDYKMRQHMEHDKNVRSQVKNHQKPFLYGSQLNQFKKDN